jgi:hypothetical protein
MSVNLTPKEDIDYFDSAQQVTLEDDRIETDIHIGGWNKKLRIRALSFAQMELINKKSTDVKTGTLDHAEWVYNTIKEGVVRPLFKYNDAKELSDNNGEFVRELADEIWNLGRISKRMWDAYILEQKRNTELEKTGNPDADEGITDDTENDSSELQSE